MTVGKVLPFGTRGSRNYDPPCNVIDIGHLSIWFTQNAAVQYDSHYMRLSNVIDIGHLSIW